MAFRVLISVGSANECSVPRQRDMPPEMGRDRMTRTVLKCQQSRLYKVSAQLIKVWEDVKDIKPQCY